MRILFIGTVDFSYTMLNKLISLKSDIVGVCTKEASSFNNDYRDLSELCKIKAIPYRYVNDINSKTNVQWIKNCKPDVIFCFGWSNLIKKELLNLTKIGVIGYHPTKLPLNRGRHPLIWALALGLNKSASTFFFMKEGADNGDILSQVEFDILYEDNAKTLYDKMSVIAQKQITELLPKLKNNTFKRITQDDSQATNWRKRSKKDGEINFKMNSRTIYNLVRALTKPYIGSHIEYNNNDICIWKVEEVNLKQENTEPGKVLKVIDNTILVKTSDSAILILEHDFKELPKIGDYL